MAKQIPGERSKRYRLSYWGQSIGSYGTAKEALKVYGSHEKLIRPAIDRKKEGRYSVRDEKEEEEITVAELRRRAKAEG